MWSCITDGPTYLDGLPKIQQVKAGDMEGGATERAVWIYRVEEDVNPPTVHKKAVDFMRRSRLLKQYKEVSGSKRGS